MNSIYKRILHRLLAEATREPLVIDIPKDLITIAHEFKRSGHKLFVVGGAVRDALLGKKPKDYDLATDAVPDRVEEIVGAMPGHRVLELGKAFGVVKVLTPEKGEYEIATFRRDIGKGRRPDAVEFTDIEQDVSRRDLTINALFYDIDAHEVVDFVGGLEDIRRNRVRAVGDPAARFDEDRLRILRAVRFAARMGSDLDSMTYQAIRDNNSLAGVSPERIRDELLKGIASAKSVTGFSLLIDELGLWDQVLPDLKVSHDYLETKNVPVFLAVLLRHNDPVALAKKLNTLKYTAAEAAQVSFLVKFQGLTAANAFRTYKSFSNSGLSRGDVEEFAAAAGEPRPDLTAAFVSYAPSVKAVDVMAQGLEGSAVGREIEQRETKLFSNLVASM